MVINFCFNLKVSIQHEKSEWIFDCFYNRIYIFGECAFGRHVQCGIWNGINVHDNRPNNRHQKQFAFD